MKTIKISGYTTNPSADDAIALAIFGGEGSGKTRFCCTAPDPIGFIPLERKSRRTAQRIAQELDKCVVMPNRDFIRVANPMEITKLKPECGKTVLVDHTAPQKKYLCCAKHYYRWHVDSVKHAAFELYSHDDIRTVVIDSGTQLWEDMLFAEFGRSQRIMPRDRGPVNQEMTDLLNALSGKNLIMTHHAAETWKNDKPSGKFEPAGFRHIGYHVNGIVEFVNDPNKGEDDEGRFYINVPLCQSNPNIQGTVNGKKLLMDYEITFPELAVRMNPETEVGDWE